MKLIKLYEKAIERSDIVDDPLQRDIIEQLQVVADALIAASKPSWFRRKKVVRGAYLYGPVGVGKTYLVDLFYQYVPIKLKARFHFHQFMQQVDAQLRLLQGQKDPLRQIAANLAKTTKLLCFDEFLVDDVGDAMILAELFRALFNAGIVLVASSNTAPDDLYLNGLQRERFLPVIDLIKTHCQVLKLCEFCDYRLGRAPLEQAYVYPLNQEADHILTKEFASIARNVQENGEISIQNRSIPYVKCAEQSIWFNFDDICNSPRSQLDYLEIADRFNTVFVSNIPILTSNHTLQVVLLINFIDVMYDRGIQLVVSAEVPVGQLYVRGDMRKEFERTLSRMEEMQSADYLSRHQKRQIQMM